MAKALIAVALATIANTEGVLSATMINTRPSKDFSIPLTNLRMSKEANKDFPVPVTIMGKSTRTRRDTTTSMPNIRGRSRNNPYFSRTRMRTSRASSAKTGARGKISPNFSVTEVNMAVSARPSTSTETSNNEALMRNRTQNSADFSGAVTNKENDSKTITDSISATVANIKTSTGKNIIGSNDFTPTVATIDESLGHAGLSVQVLPDNESTLTPKYLDHQDGNNDLLRYIRKFNIKVNFITFQFCSKQNLASLFLYGINLINYMKLSHQ